METLAVIAMLLLIVVVGLGSGALLGVLVVRGPEMFRAVGQASAAAHEALAAWLMEINNRLRGYVDPGLFLRLQHPETDELRAIYREIDIAAGIDDPELATPEKTVTPADVQAATGKRKYELLGIPQEIHFAGGTVLRVDLDGTQIALVHQHLNQTVWYGSVDAFRKLNFKRRKDGTYESDGWSRPRPDAGWLDTPAHASGAISAPIGRFPPVQGKSIKSVLDREIQEKIKEMTEQHLRELQQKDREIEYRLRRTREEFEREVKKRS